MKYLGIQMDSLVEDPPLFPPTMSMAAEHGDGTRLAATESERVK